jgi:uncharacterized protein (TIGR02145 family)
MKTSRFPYLPWVLIVIVLLISQNGCKKDKEVIPDNPPANDFPETTKLISDKNWDENIITVDSSTWTLTFNSAITRDYDLKVGDVIFSSKGQGLLRKITDIKNEGGNLVVQTVQATIVEAWPKGRVLFHKDLTEDLKKAKVTYAAEGVTFHGIGEARDDCGDCVGFKCTWEKEIADHVTLEGEVELSPTLYLYAVWKEVVPDTLILTITTTETLTITSTVDIMSLTLKKEVLLGKITLTPYPIPGTPIVVTPVISIKLGANLEINSEITAGVRQTLSYTTGFKYIEGDITKVIEMDKSLEPILPTLSNTLEAKAYIKPELNMIIDYVISPYLNMEMYAKLEAELGGDPWWELFAGIKCRGGFKAGIWGFFDITMLDAGVDIFDYKFPIADANGTHIPPTADFTVSPDVGTTQTLFQFNASGCHDEEDDEDDLEVRWDFDGDGTWDTDWSTDKMASHQYSTLAIYSAVLEVRDTDGDTDEMTREVYVGFFTDPRDGQTYNVIEIGGQMWLGENLNYVTDSSYCYDHNPENCNKYGRLYSWNVAKRACPDGWHLPTDEEWKVLERTLGMPEDELDDVGYRGTDQGTQLKENGSSGFEALLSGWRSDVFGDFSDLEVKGLYWTGSSASSTNVWYRELDTGETGVGRYQTLKINGLAIRCIKE